MSGEDEDTACVTGGELMRSSIPALLAASFLPTVVPPSAFEYVALPEKERTVRNRAAQRQRARWRKMQGRTLRRR
jgi:hypothetical protein